MPDRVCRGPLLTLVTDCLPNLKEGVAPFLTAMLNGAGATLGSSVTNVVGNCPT